MNRRLWRLGWLLTALLVTGCGKSQPASCPITGTVWWQGNPVPKGDIVFEPIDGVAVPDAGKIKDGKFALAVKPGKKRVEIHACHEGKIDPVMGQAPSIPYIPEQYNSQSILQIDVTPGGENHFEFKLPEARRQPG